MSAIIIPFPDRTTPRSHATGRGRGSRIGRHTVTAGLSAEGLWEQSEDEWCCQAHHVVDQVEAMLGDGTGREVMGLCEQAMRCLLDAAPEIDDGDAVLALIDRLRDVHRRACELDLARGDHPSAV